VNYSGNQANATNEHVQLADIIIKGAQHIARIMVGFVALP
jgi:hypothetical protein